MLRRAWMFWPLCLLVARGPSVAAPESAWPVAGELGGRVEISALAGLSPEWTLRSGADGLELAARAPGVDVAVALAPLGSDACRWRIVRGVVDLGEVWPAVREMLGAAAAGWSASGRVELAGEGEWRANAPDAPTGELRVALREGWARSDALGAEISGIELDATTREPGALALPATQSLRVARVTVAGAELKNASATFGLTAARELDLTAATVEFLGGRINLKPLRVPLDDPKVDGAAEVVGLRLDEAAKLMPWAVRSAAGLLRGRVELAWDQAKGLRVRDGGLDIVRADGAQLRLAPSPGLLTGNQGKRFALLPQSWGPLSRLFSINNPAYDPLRRIELGEEGLSIDSFQVTFRPDGPQGARTATVHVEGRPTGGKLVESVTIDLNFYGPWTEFLAFGLNQEANYGFSVK